VPTLSAPDEQEETELPSVDEHPQDWRAESSERLENYRKRRARLNPNAEAEKNLELDFAIPDEPRYSPTLSPAEKLAQEHAGFDMDIGERAEPEPVGADPSTDLVHAEDSGAEAMVRRRWSSILPSKTQKKKGR
jgi:hypothetical protein